MRLDDLYPGTGTTPQPVSQGASADRNTAPMPPASGAAVHAVPVSFLGILLALVLIRVVYEVSE